MAEPATGPVTPVAALFFTTMAFATVTTPLWSDYQTRYGFGPTTVSWAFATMAIGVLAGLPTLGGLSDSWGRQLVLRLSVGLGLLATGVFLIPGTPALFIARFIQGVEIGVMLPTAPAAISERLAAAGHRGPRLAAGISTLANLGGLGAGAMISALTVTIAGRPLASPYLIFALLLLLAGRWVTRRPDVTGKPARRYHLRRPTAPRTERLAYLGAGAVGLAALAAFSIYASLGPGILVDVFAAHNLLAAPAVYLAVMSCGAVGQLGLTRLPPLLRRILCPALMACGFTITAAATSLKPVLALFVAGACLIGLGAGCAFADASAAVIRLARPETAAGTQSGFFIMAYIGMIAPIVILAGLQQLLGTPAALIWLGAGLTVLTTIGLLAAITAQQSSTHSPLNQPTNRPHATKPR